MDSAALWHFKKAMESCKVPNGESISIRDAGWLEECPRECYWHFIHPDFPGVEVRWIPGREPRLFNIISGRPA